MIIRIGKATAIILVLVSVGCQSKLQQKVPATFVVGRVINERSGNPVPNIDVRILDVRPHSGMLGLVNPEPVAVAKSNANGVFQVKVFRKLPREWIAVEFAGIPNLEAMEKGMRIVDVSARPINASP
jgi:hypothetical protein